MNTGAAPTRVLKDLGVTALLGSDRAARAGETPAALLARAAVAGVRARAGRRCRAEVEAVEACPADARAAATASQAATLERLLASSEGALIDEWCVLALGRGVRVPEAVVPVLLDWWARQPSRSAAVFEATGACGAWLAGLRAEWRRPVAGSEIPADAEEAWQTGSAAERAALLATVRRVDPERGLAMVRATWGSDGAEERARFVEILARGVSAADEPFLEAALEDRSKAVRREAVRALTRLPGSALRGRMRARAEPLIVVEKAKGGLLRRGKSTITIEPPGAFDKAWERDGVEERAAAGTGKRAFWLVQVLSATDLVAWTDLTGLPPADVLAAISGDEFVDAVLGAMTASVAACPGQPGSEAWSEALIAACAAQKLAHEERVSAIWAAQGHEQSERLRLRFLTQGRAVRGEVMGAAAWRLLASDPRGWSRDFSVEALRILRGATPKKADGWEFWGLIESVSTLLHPAAAEQFEVLVGEMCPEGASESIRKSVDRVRLRAEMHREFQS
jgi:hypothetical protein